MLQITQKPIYLKLLASYKAGNRFNAGSPEYNQILMLESLDPNWTKSTRLSNGIDVPTLIYTETMTTGPAPKPNASGELFFTPSDPVTTIGLPPGTTPTGTTPTTTTPGTTENFLSKYKMPLIIGAVAIGYFLLKKKK
jgi:hypothetical protein